MRRSRFGPGAYVVRYAWWSPIVPALAGAALIAGFVVGATSRPAWMHLRPGRHMNPWDWTEYGAQWVMPAAGLGLLILAMVYLSRVLSGTVAFAIAPKGVYWCPSGKLAKGAWFDWDEVTAIEFHSAEGGSTGRGAVALRGYAPDPDDRPRLVSTRLGGWRIGRRRLDRALREFAPDVDVIR